MLKRLLLGALALIVWFAALTGIQIVLHDQRAEIWARLLVALTLLVIYWAAARFIERRAVDELRLRDTPAAVYGFAGGFCLFLCTMLILMVAGAYHPSSFASDAALSAGLSLAFTAAVAEELLFRGFIFRWLEQGVGTWIAVAVSAALFGFAHAVNRGATPMSTVAIALEAGVLLSAAYVYSRTLWLPIGIHVGWNFTEGTIFGVAVSGHSATGGILSGTLNGPVWLNGGAFGVEATLPAVVVCVAAASALLVLAARRNRIVPPRWQRVAAAA
jgi:uncharacterized protein